MKIKTEPQDIWQEYQKGRQYKEAIKLFSNVKKNENFFLGRQWEGLNAPDLPKPVLNFLKRVVTFVVATITSNDIAVSLTPHERDDEKQMYAKAIGRQVERVFEFTKYKTLLRRCVRDSAVDGDACIYFRFDPDIETGQDAKGDIAVEILKNINVIFGNPYNRDVQSQPYIIICQRKTVGELRDEGREYGMSREDIEQITPDSDECQREEGSETILATKLTKFWIEDKHLMWTATTEKTVMRKPTKTGATMYPITWMSWDEVDSSYHGQAMLTGLIPNQIEVNRMFAMYIRSVSMNAFPKIVIDSQKIKNWTNRPGEVIKADNLSGSRVQDYVTAIRGGDVSHQVMDIIERIITMTRDFMGASDAALGNVKPDNTSAIIAVQQASSMPLELQKLNEYQFVEDGVRIIMDIMRAYYGIRRVSLEEEIVCPATDEMGRPVIDPVTGQPAMETITEIEYDFGEYEHINYDTNVDVGASSYWSELMQVQTMDNLFAKKILTDAVTYIESIPGKYLRNKDKIIEKIKEQQEMLAQQQAMMQQTASIPETEMPVTDTTTQELVNQVAAARSEVMGKARQMT